MIFLKYSLFKKLPLYKLSIYILQKLQTGYEKLENAYCFYSKNVLRNPIKKDILSY